MGQFITPPTIPSDTYCRRILIPNSPEWIGTVTGALLPLIYSSEWVQTTGISPEEAASRALEMFNLYVNSGNDGECGDMACCNDTLVISRVNPTTGAIETSNDGGTTWQPAKDSLRSIIVNPIPPVTSGTSANKCDASTNLKLQVDAWITQVSNDFTTAENLTAFASAVFEAILTAVLVLLTGGALTGVAALIIPTIGAALAATWVAGKAAFDAYWTDVNKEKVLCAAYCTIGDDGSFNDAQATAFWNKCNTDLPPNAAKMLFMGFLSSIGKEGLNAMAATGASSGSDCTACDCGTCGCSLSSWVKIDDRMNEPTRDESTCQIHQEAALIAGNYYIGIKTAYPNCCIIELHVVSGGSSGANLICGCDYTGELSLDEGTGWTPAGLTTVDNLRGWLLRSATPFEVYWSF